MLDLPMSFRWNISVVSFFGPLPGKLFEILIRRFTGREKFIGVLIPKFVQRKMAHFCELDTSLQNMWTIGKEFCHLARRFESSLPIWEKLTPEFRYGS